MRIGAAFLSLLLAGCVGGHGSAQDAARHHKEARAFLHADGERQALRQAAIRRLAAVKEQIEQIAGELRPQLIVTMEAQPNGMVYFQEGRPTMAVSLGMIDLLGDDEDAYAALVGHELAHLYLKHGESRRSRGEKQDGESGLLAFALAVVGIPFGSTLADAASTVVSRSYSRDDEREADRLGLEYMMTAGFNPWGAVRLHEKLDAKGERALVPFLATHPTGAERVEAMRERARTAAPQSRDHR